MTTDRVTCPRCGESLPSDFERCDACGATIEPGSHAHAPAPAAEASAAAPKRPASAGSAKGRRPGPRPARQPQGVPGIAWLLLVVGLVVGGMVGFALHSAVAPREEAGMPRGPADIMAGQGGDRGMGGMPGGAQGGAQAGAPQGMPPQILQMVREYKDRIAKNPKDLDALIGLGNLEFDSSQMERAVDYYSRALTIDPRNADVRVDRAIAYHSTGQNDVAKQELLRVTRENPTHKNAWLNLGVVLRELGDRPGAVRAWESYLKLDPSGEHSATVRQEIESIKRAG